MGVDALGFHLGGDDAEPLLYFPRLAPFDYPFPTRLGFCQIKNYILSCGMWVLSATPRELGFDKPDDYCRFLRMPGPQKCGVSPFDPQHYSNLSYSPEHDAYIFIVVEPPPGTDDSAIADRMTEIVLERMPE